MNKNPKSKHWSWPYNIFLDQNTIKLQIIKNLLENKILLTHQKWNHSVKEQWPMGIQSVGESYTEIHILFVWTLLVNYVSFAQNENLQLVWVPGLSLLILNLTFNVAIISKELLRKGVWKIIYWAFVHLKMPSLLMEVLTKHWSLFPLYFQAYVSIFFLTSSFLNEILVVGWFLFFL